MVGFGRRGVIAVDRHHELDLGALAEPDRKRTLRDLDGNDGCTGADEGRALQSLGDDERAGDEAHLGELPDDRRHMVGADRAERVVGVDLDRSDVLRHHLLAGRDIADHLEDRLAVVQTRIDEHVATDRDGNQRRPGGHPSTPPRCRSKAVLRLVGGDRRRRDPRFGQCHALTSIPAQAPTRSTVNAATTSPGPERDVSGAVV